jgi:dihydroneopterin aldolase
VEGSAYQTIEALATAIARTVTINHNTGAVIVRVEKPNAISSIDAAGIQLRRTASFFREKTFG